MPGKDSNNIVQKREQDRIVINDKLLSQAINREEKSKEFPEQNGAILLERASSSLESEKPDYEAAIRFLEQTRDLTHGIQSWHIPKETFGLSTDDVYISDAREALPKKKQYDSFEDWAAMGLSYYRLADTMIDIELKRVQNQLLSMKDSPEKTGLRSQLEKLTSARQLIQTKAQKFLYTIQRATSLAETIEEKRQFAQIYFTKAIKKDLCPYLYSTLKGIKSPVIPNDSKELQNQMSAMRDFGSLKRQPTALITIRKGLKEKEYVVRVDMPLYQLTDTQKAELAEIHQYSNGNLNAKVPQWFSQQKNELAKSLIGYYAQDILEGRDLPTQLLSFIPYLRNAAEVREYTVDSDQKLTELSRLYRSGNVGNEAPDALKNTQETARQMALNTGANTVFMNGLLATDTLRADVRNFVMEKTGKPDEQKLSDRDKEAIEAMGHDQGTRVKFIYGNVGINAQSQQLLRFASISGDATALEAIMLMGEATINRLENQLHLDSSDSNSAIDSNAQATLLTIKMMMELVFNEYKTLKEKHLSYSGEKEQEHNVNTRLNALSLEMGSLISQCNDLFPRGNLDETVVFTFCKSGKDRTAVAIVAALAEREAQQYISKHWDENHATERSHVDQTFETFLASAEGQQLYHQAIQQSVKNQIESGVHQSISAKQSSGSYGIVDNEDASLKSWFEGEEGVALKAQWKENEQAYNNSKITLKLNEVESKKLKQLDTLEKEAAAEFDSIIEPRKKTHIALTERQEQIKKVILDWALNPNKPENKTAFIDTLFEIDLRINQKASSFVSKDDCIQIVLKDYSWLLDDIPWNTINRQQVKDNLLSLHAELLRNYEVHRFLSASRVLFSLDSLYSKKASPLAKWQKLDKELEQIETHTVDEQERLNAKILHKNCQGISSPIKLQTCQAIIAFREKFPELTQLPSLVDFERELKAQIGSEIVKSTSEHKVITSVYQAIVGHMFVTQEDVQKLYTDLAGIDKSWGSYFLLGSAIDKLVAEKEFELQLEPQLPNEIKNAKAFLQQAIDAPVLDSSKPNELISTTERNLLVKVNAVIEKYEVLSPEMINDLHAQFIDTKKELGTKFHFASAVEKTIDKLAKAKGFIITPQKSPSLLERFYAFLGYGQEKKSAPKYEKLPTSETQSTSAEKAPATGGLLSGFQALISKISKFLSGNKKGYSAAPTSESESPREPSVEIRKSESSQGNPIDSKTATIRAKNAEWGDDPGHDPDRETFDNQRPGTSAEIMEGLYQRHIDKTEAQELLSLLKERQQIVQNFKGEVREFKEQVCAHDARIQSQVEKCLGAGIPHSTISMWAKEHNNEGKGINLVIPSSSISYEK